MCCSSRVCFRSFTFMIYINDLNLAIKYCKVHHFADDTNLLNINKSPQKLNKIINADLKTTWLNDKKIPLNVSKTEKQNLLFSSLRYGF